MPPVISHGLNAQRTGRSRYHLALRLDRHQRPDAVALRPRRHRHARGLPARRLAELRARNHALVVAGRRLLLERLGIAPPCPESLLGSIATIPLGAGDPVALHDALYERHRIEVPCFPWPAPGRRCIRISAQIYNSLEDYARLADALAAELA